MTHLIINSKIVQNSWNHLQSILLIQPQRRVNKSNLINWKSSLQIKAHSSINNILLQQILFLLTINCFYWKIIFLMLLFIYLRYCTCLIKKLILIRLIFHSLYLCNFTKLWSKLNTNHCLSFLKIVVNPALHHTKFIFLKFFCSRNYQIFVFLNKNINESQHRSIHPFFIFFISKVNISWYCTLFYAYKVFHHLEAESMRIFDDFYHFYDIYLIDSIY